MDLNVRNLGQTIEVELPEANGYAGYCVECCYRYVKSEDRYSLTMRLRKKWAANGIKIDYQDIGTQYITGTKETIRKNVVRVVHQASISGFFDEYIRLYEEMYRYYMIGKEYCEKERSE